MAFDLKSALAAGAGAALTGAGVGSTFGPAGAVVGGALGLLGGGLAGGFKSSSPDARQAYDAFFASPEGQRALSRFSPQQQEYLTSLLQSGQSQLQNQYAGFEPIQKEATNYFQQQLVPSLTESFQSSGRNAISSPVLQTNLSSAAASLTDRLAAQRAQYGMENQRLGLEQLRLGLSPMYGAFGEPGAGGLVNQLNPIAFQNLISAFNEWNNRRSTGSIPAEQIVSRG